MAAMGGVVLCADDYGLTDAVSRGIRELAQAGRLTATSAIVTMPGWMDFGQQIRELRSSVAIGLHLNLTLGAPLRPMERLAPDGRLPGVGRLVRIAFTGGLGAQDIREEIERQLDAFEAAIGQPPDHVDGHQHVHVLPVVRSALFAALSRRFTRPRELLVRDPGDRPARILRRGLETGKALAVSGLAAGFGSAARSRGFATNDGFAGFSSFSRGRPYASELMQAMTVPGPRSIVMCHPGHSDEALGRLDPVVERRDEELAALLGWTGLETVILRPRRIGAGGPVDWWGEAGNG